MLNKPFDDIEKDIIDALIAEQVSETKQLEYKKELPSGTEKEKVEFLSDVCSFANASGGHIIYGLGDKKDTDGKNTGIPEYVGLTNINIDDQKLRLEHMSLNGIVPRIPGIQIKPIEGFDNGPLLILRIPKSWSSPHMVRHNNRFYSRTSAGKYPLDVQEIRAAFALSEALPERIRGFRGDRLAKIAAGETPVTLHDGGKMVLHVVPFSSFDQQKTYDLSMVEQPQLSHLHSIGSPSGFRLRYNFFGLLTYEQARDEPAAFSYVQLFRNGIIESLDTLILQASSEAKRLSRGYEEEVVRAIGSYINFQKAIGVESPIFVMLSFLKVKGYTIGGVQSPYSRRGQHPIDMDTLIVPEVMLESFDCDLKQVMRSPFDTVWNAAGWPRSMNYDENGKWVS
ncbi:MAG: AlbA family DNA-binding domain-containing protein [Planctomycetota bacterium]